MPKKEHTSRASISTSTSAASAIIPYSLSRLLVPEDEEQDKSTAASGHESGNKNHAMNSAEKMQVTQVFPRWMVVGSRLGASIRQIPGHHVVKQGGILKPNY